MAFKIFLPRNFYQPLDGVVICLADWTNVSSVMGKFNLSDLETWLHLHIDKHAREIQYGVYGVALAGLLVISRSVGVFSRYTRVKDIPSEFINKGFRLRGEVCGISSVSIDSAYTASIDARTYYKVCFQIAHLPIVGIKLFRKVKSTELLNAELAGVYVTTGGLETVDEFVSGRMIWFTLLGSSQDGNFLHISIKQKRSWSFWEECDLAKHILKCNKGVVSPYLQNIQASTTYEAYYRQLMMCESRRQLKEAAKDNLLNSIQEWFMKNSKKT